MPLDPHWHKKFFWKKNFLVNFLDKAKLYLKRLFSKKEIGKRVRISYFFSFILTHVFVRRRKITSLMKLFWKKVFGKRKTVCEAIMSYAKLTLNLNSNYKPLRITETIWACYDEVLLNY